MPKEHGTEADFLEELDKLEDLVEDDELNFFSRISFFMLRWFRMIGLFFLRFLRRVKRVYLSFYRRHLQRHIFQLNLTRLQIHKFISRLMQYGLHRLICFVRFFPDAVRVIKKGYHAHPSKNVFYRCMDALRAFGKGVANNSHLFVTLVNYALPIVSIYLLVSLIGYVQGLNFAVSVEYQDEQLGYIASEKVFEEAETRLQQRLTYLPTDEVIDALPRFTVAVAEPDELKSSVELTDAIIENSKADMVQATGLYIDDKLIGVVRDFSRIQRALNQMLDTYKTNQADERVDFTKKVESEPGLYLASNLVEEASILELITSETEGNVFYTVKEGDVPSTIAQNYGMSTDELVALNPGILEKLMVGQSVLVNKSKPYLPVMCIRTETYSVETSFNTTYTTTDQAYEGEVRTVTAGKKGENSVTAEVAYVDNVEVERTVLSTVVITEPVDAVLARGTKVMQKAEIAQGANTANSGMINPILQRVPYLSQPYKGTAHNGIDIAFRGNGYGCPIVSVLPGTVTYAGWRGTYGNLVVINHGNGYETWYAHCSKLYVSTGQQVTQGESIAAVGNTGRSFGNHLHFRVIANGVQVNPLNYIPGY